MKEQKAKDIFFILYLLIVLVLGVIYFTVPERAVLLDNTAKWWLSALEKVSGVSR